MRKKIAIDQDQVLADFLQELVYRYNNDYSDNLTPESFTDWNLVRAVKSECGLKIFEYLEDGKFFANLPVINDSQEIVYELNRMFEIFIVTSPWNKYSVVYKFEWLEKHFPFLNSRNFVFTQNKSIISPDYFIDDRALDFDGVSGNKLLFDAAHNRTETGYYRVHDWKEIGDIFKVS